MITALLKLARLNHTATKLKKLDEGFQTHPSIARRIKQIERISGYNYDLNLGVAFRCKKTLDKKLISRYSVVCHHDVGV